MIVPTRSTNSTDLDEVLVNSIGQIESLPDPNKYNSKSNSFLFLSYVVGGNFIYLFGPEQIELIMQTMSRYGMEKRNDDNSPRL